MKQSDSVRAGVQDAYAKAVSAPTKKSCCGNKTVPKGVVAKLAGYSAEELAALPADTVANSFGCGNPLAFSQVQPGQVVLDLGSGAGIDILLAAKKVGPAGRVIGIDMTDEMIARAGQNVVDAGLTNVEVRKGLIEELPVEDASVDWVISNCVINLSPEKQRVFAEIARVLRSGGQISVSDIVAAEMPAWIAENEALHASCIAGAISEQAYIEGLQLAGLVDVQVRERLVYDASQLAAFAGSEPAGQQASQSCCGAPIDSDFAQRAARALQGKVWSAKFYARKP
jgi:SAM-dependent methyltransferase